MESSVEYRQNLLPKASHLFLLIGGNPLPNFVAAKLLAKHNETLILVHSEKTRLYAEYLRNCLTGADWPFANIHFLQIKESDPHDIETKVKHKAMSLAQNAKLGLHYTGGTKMMVAKAYEVLNKMSRDIPMFNSYLDASSMELVIEKPVQSPLRVPTDCLLDLSLQDLIGLHGRKFQNEEQIITKLILPETAKAIACIKPQKVEGMKGLTEPWDEWLSTELRNNPDAKKEITEGGKKNVASASFRKITEEKPLFVKWPTNNALQHFARMLSNESNQRMDNPLDIGALANKAGIEGSEMSMWLNSKWLESAVMSALDSIKDTHFLHDIKMSVEVTPSGKDLKFELDVVAMRGYQLFCFSCGTAGGGGESEKSDIGKGELKHKLFEVDARAQQMGGGQARAALVCRYNRPAELEREAGALLENSNRIKVFGREHLPQLAKNLGDWINDSVRG